MELNDIIYNVLLLVGLFFTGFFALGIFFSRSQRKAFKNKFEHNNNLYLNKVYTDENRFYTTNVINQEYSYQRNYQNRYYTH